MPVGELFNPRSIALVGATDKSGWSISTLTNLRTHGFRGPVHLVNPRGGVVHGEQAHRSLSDIPGQVDLAYVMVPTTAVLPVLREGAKLGIRHYVILTAGFGETGPEGAALEAEIVDFARESDLTVLGPNGNGFINAAADVTPYGLPIPSPLLRGSVGVVLQSGALASSVLGFAQARNVGVSLLTSMGNESLVTVTDVIDYLVDDPATKAIALFLESVRDPAAFSRAARRALLAGKPIVALKIGRSRLASRTAQAHTGALVGDDNVIDAAFRQLGVVRVRSLEDLIITAGLLAEVGPLPGPRIGVVTPSGGASEIIADRAEDEGLELPAFAPETVARLREIVPAFGTVQNPLDVTGYVLIDRTLLGRALEAVTADPGVDAVMLLSDLPRVAPPDPAPVYATFSASARRMAEAPMPVVVVSNVLTDVTEFGRDVQRQAGFPYVAGGIEHGMHAIGAAVRWGRAYRAAVEAADAAVPAEAAVSAPAVEPGTGVWAEHRAAALLSSAGIPVVPGELVHDEESAVAAAVGFGYPVVLKAAAEGLGHKSDIGGVRLGLSGARDVERAYREVVAAAAAVPGAGRVGALVQPQRGGGVELLVGIVRDPAWGLTLAVGLGGIWVEALRDTALRVLPVDAAEARRALDELRGAALLRGARGTEPADLDAVAAVVARVAAFAGSLGDDLESLEINPLLVRGSHVEALDALITWRDRPGR
ncbi:Acyl-CoA synthetase (NDP forming) [Microbispora rosea]|uniref:Acyl-CoA synthetase (NDP forming) n=1 Tax=Microbispora rosea TaxID=58117 RepID=A0A1N7B6P0_9ACTN|nr:acetate--CoA ligase family protein [Microbispora rosea]GIH51544.1 pimeloyl-CoA synthetase [Microbispora rosea subsp. rosea]SIR47030.1 Acyl-CoA synthetase (NDP forming) [Microbispora rosea]